MADNPVTREEKYLAYLTGDYTGEIPKPITRKEKYLYELCLKGIGGEISPEEIKNAVNEYLEKNPVKPGATTEQAQQIEQNKTDIASLKKETGSLKEEFVNVLDLETGGKTETLVPTETLTGYYYNSSYSENSGYITKKYDIVGNNTYYVSTKTNEATGTGLIHWFDNSNNQISYVNKGIGVWEDIEVVAPVNAVSCAITGKITDDYDASRKISLKTVQESVVDSKRLRNIETIKAFKRMAVSIDENKNLIIASKYSNDYDLWISMTKNGASMIPQIGKIYKKENQKIEIGTDFNNIPDAFYSPSSDWISPYGSLYAKENPDTDITDKFYWCGGWHGTNGGNGGSATAKNIEYRVLIDNAERIDSGIYYGDEIKVVIINGINAINTVKKDGSGRNVITETITYKFKPNCEIEIDGKIQINENVSLDHYYGIQCEFLNVWNGGQLNVNDITNKGWFTNANASINGSTKKESIINNFFVRTTDKKDCIECYITPNYGLADRAYLLDDVSTAFTNAYNKSYFRLLNKKQLSKDDVLCWRGGYHFYSN